MQSFKKTETTDSSAMDTGCAPANDTMDNTAGSGCLRLTVPEGARQRVLAALGYRPIKLYLVQREKPLPGNAFSGFMHRQQRSGYVDAGERAPMIALGPWQSREVAVRRATPVPRQRRSPADWRGNGRKSKPGGTAVESSTWTKRTATSPSWRCVPFRIRSPVAPPRKAP